MNTQATSTNAIDWKYVGAVALRAAWWLLKMAFKLIALLTTVMITVVVAMFQYEEPEEERDKKHWSDPDFDDLFNDGDYSQRSNRFKNNR